MSCSSKTPKKAVTPKANLPVVTEQALMNAEQTVLSAQEGMQTDLTPEQLQQKIAQLSEASRLFFQENNYVKAAWLAEQTLQLLAYGSQNNAVTENPENLHQRNNISLQLMLVKAKSYQALNDTTISQLELEKMALFTKQHELALPIDYYQLTHEMLLKKGQLIPAFRASLHVYSLERFSNDDDKHEAALQLWSSLTLLSPWQIDLLKKESAPSLSGWLALNRIASKYSHDTGAFSRYVMQWKRQHPNHPAVTITGDLTAVQLTSKHIENIAVILPLTGKQHKAGLAVQQGVLAAFEQENNRYTAQSSATDAGDLVKNLHFYDSNTLDWQNLPSQFKEQEIDFVIGPLLKSHLNKYMALDFSAEQQSDNSISASDDVLTNTAPDHPMTLLLNVPSNQELPDKHFAFSMRPEDEAIQAAATLSQVGFKKAIVLSHQDNASKRIAKAFVKQWEKQTEQTLSIVYFEQGKAMQNNLKASLDVSTSQARIDELQSRLKQTLKEQTRNRRDIDMIYVVGTAQQTRLVKPYIDVNISPFSSLIPIYASSRSHSIKNDSSTTNDLQGLTFTEIPWLLDSSIQNKPLASLSQELWPKRSDSLSRIFAMGFDSYNLINKLPLMLNAPHARHTSQTGTLQLNENNVLTRSLIWGRYQTNGVNEITLN